MNNQRNAFYPQYHSTQGNCMQPPRTPAPVMTGNATDCAELMDMINKASFAMDDTRLFLDTNPDCVEAMEYFKKMEKIRKEAIKEYECQVGPVVAYQSAGDCDDGWLWNKGPLPWENRCCNGRRV